MRITVISDKRIPMCDVDCGAVFKYNNNHYMKLRYEEREDLPCYGSGAVPTVVCLEDGSLACFVDTTLVEVIGAELRVKE